MSFQRFPLRADLQGGHEHYLNPVKRQGASTSVWSRLTGKKQSSSPAAIVEKYGKCQEVLGSGASGTVWVLRKNLEIEPREELYAVKQLRRTPDETENAYRKRVTATFCISSELQHPNVIRTVDLLHEPKECSYKVMELCTGGNLFMRLQSATKLEVQEADCFFKQLMSGVEYIHQMGVAHRDLKPENLLLTRHGRLKICDFDYSECFRMAWEDDVHMVSGLCGSEPYVAPEAFIEKEFDGRATDVWACGIIYMAMRIGRFLWNIAKKDEDDLYAQYLGDRRHEDGFLPIEGFPGSCCRNVIYCMLDPVPSRRITASQTLCSEWSRQIQICKAAEIGEE